MQYVGGSPAEVYSTYCQDSSSAADENPAPPKSSPSLESETITDAISDSAKDADPKNVVKKFGKMAKPEDALGTRQKEPVNIGSIASMLWLAIPCSIALIVLYRRKLRSSRSPEMRARETFAAISSGEDTAPLRENTDLESPLE